MVDRLREPRTWAGLFVVACVASNCAQGTSPAGCASGCASQGGCGGQGGCAVDTIPGGFPTREEMPAAMQVRVSKTGVSFFEKNASSLVSALLPNGLDFDIPPTCDQSVLIGKVHICATKQGSTCVASKKKCTLQAKISSLELTPNPTAGNKLQVTAYVSAKTAANAPITTTGLVSCTIDVDTSKGSQKTVALVVDVKFAIDATTKRTRVVLENPTLANLETSDISMSGGLCSLANLPLIKDLLLGQMKNALSGQIAKIFDKQLCLGCDTTKCPSGTTCDSKTKLCMRGSSCVQQLGTEGRATVDMLGAKTKLDYLVHLGGSVGMRTSGINLGLNGGMAAPGKPASCIKPRPDLKPDPQKQRLGTPKSLEKNLDPDGKPFDVGVGVYRSFLDFAGWAAYTGGALCLQAGSDLSSLLTTDAFTLIMPSLAQLTGGSPAAVRLAIRPGTPPRFTLGKGVVKDKGKGNYAIQSPLLKVGLKDFHIDFYALLDQRYVRVLRLTADVELPLALVMVGSEIQPVLGELGNAFQNLRVTGSDLLSENPKELAAKFPVVLKLALGFIPDLLDKGIALPNLMGLALQDPKFTGIENNTVLGVFAKLQRAKSTTAAHLSLPLPSPPARTEAQLIELQMPAELDVMKLRRKADLARGPRAVIEVGGRSDGRQLEYSWRVDGTTWSPFVAGPRLELQSPLLFLLGEHTVEVRARVRGLPSTTDPTPARVTFNVRDPRRPPAPQQVDSELGGGCAAAPGAPDDGWPALLLPLLLLVGLRLRGVRRIALAAALALAAGASGGCSGDPGSGDDASVCGSCAKGNYCCESSEQCERIKYNCTTKKSCDPGYVLDYGDPPYMDSKTCQPLELTCSCKEADPLIPGSIGRHSSLVAVGDKLVVSAYEDKYGDLLVITAETSALTEHKTTIVDGLPSSAPPTGAPSGYRKGVSDKGDDVGVGTDIAAASDGTLYISYHDVTNDSLKIAIGTGGKWDIHTVAKPTDSSKEVVGLYSSIVLRSGKPAIAYLAQNISDTKGGFRSELRWAEASDTDPASSSDWTETVIDKGPTPCRGLCATGEACFVTSTGSACKKKGTGCSKCTSKQACLAGKCTAILPDVKYQDVPAALGLWPRAVLHSAGPLVVYHDSVKGRLKVAKLSGGKWTTSTIAGKTTTNTKADATGAFPSAALDAKGRLHISYQNVVRETLHYLQLDVSTLKATKPETVDDGIRTDGQHPVGADSALIITSGSTVSIAYQDQQNSDLLVARRATANSWQPNDKKKDHLGRLFKGGAKGYGFYNRLTAIGGKIYGSTFFFDAKGKQRGDLELFSLP